MVYGTYNYSYLDYNPFITGGVFIANLKDTLQQMTNSLLVNVDIPIDTKRLVRIKVSM